MKEGYEKYCRFFMCEEKECWYNGCQCEGERLIIPKETFDKDVERSYSEEEVKKLTFNFYYDMSRKMSVPENLISENFTNLEEWFEQNKKK